MATNEIPGLLKYKDEEGNVNLLLPITTIDNVDGMDEIEASLSETVKFTEQNLTDEQKAQARENLGIASDGSSDISWDNITNKPFGEIENLVDIHPLTTHDNLTLHPIFNIYGVGESAKYTLTVGESYKVFWDGIEYDCIAQDTNAILPTGVAIGNLSAFGLSGNNEPFIIIITAQDNITAGYIVQYASLTDTAPGGSHSVRIAQKETVVKPIDHKYLPEHLQFGETNSLVDLLPLTTYDNFYLDEIYGGYMNQELAPFSLTIGEIYTVFWDGNEYSCVAQDGSSVIPGVIALGNASAFGLIGNNEPFIMSFIEGMGIKYTSLTDTEPGGSHSVRIAQEGTIVKPINTKYLPEHLQFGNIPAGTVIVPETTVTLSDNYDVDLYIATIPYMGLSNYVYEGCKCLIKVDDNVYESYAYISADGISIGYNVASPFFAVIISENFEGTGESVILSSQSGKHTFSVIIAEDIIQKLDPKYFPEHLQFGEYEGLVDLLPSTVFELSTTFGPTMYGAVVNTPDYNIVVDETYVVIWDGVEYECVGVDVSSVLPNTVAVGNGSVFGFSGNNEPFMITLEEGECAQYISLTDTERGGSHSVRIAKEGTIVTKLDPKYLPDDIGGTTLPEVTTSDAGKFLRVGADGTWVAEAIPNAEEASF